MLFDSKVASARDVIAPNSLRENDKPKDQYKDQGKDKNQGKDKDQGKRKASGASDERVKRSNRSLGVGFDNTAVQDVVDYWRQKVNRPDAPLTLARGKTVAARLKENGGDVDELKQAIDGAFLDDWQMGLAQGSTRRNDDLCSILRDRSHVERFLGRVEEQAWLAERARRAVVFEALIGRVV